MSESVQRIPAAGVRRVTIEAERANLSLRWLESDELRVMGEGVDIERQDDEVWLGVRGGGRRGGFGPGFVSGVEIGDEGVAVRLGDLGEFVAGAKEGVSFRLGDFGEFSAGPEGVNLIGAGQEIRIGQGGPRILGKAGKASKVSKSKVASGGWIEIELPASLPALEVELRQGDLDLTEVRGAAELRVDHGDLEIHGGEARVSAKVGVGEIWVEQLTGSLSLEGGSGEIRVEQHRGNLSISAGSSDVSLTRVDGSVAVNLGGGNLAVTGGAGKLAVNSGAGDIAVRDHQSPATAVNTGSGDVTVAGGSVERLAVHTGSGDIRCRAALGPDEHELRTGSGDVVLGVPRDLAARFKVSTSRGSVDSEIPLVTVGQRGPRSALGRRLVGSIGDGEPRADITIRTIQGDIRMHWIEPAAPGPRYAPPRPSAAARPAPPPRPARPGGLFAGGSGRAEREETSPRPASTDDDEARRGILRALAEGTISVEEAGRLLDALQKRGQREGS